MLVYKQSLLMLVARAHKEKTASQGRRTREEKRVLYPGKTSFVPKFKGGKASFVPKNEFILEFSRFCVSLRHGN
jgi:hypothetical protein